MRPKSNEKRRFENFVQDKSVLWWISLRVRYKHIQTRLSRYRYNHKKSNNWLSLHCTYVLLRVHFRYKRVKPFIYNGKILMSIWNLFKEGLTSLPLCSIMWKRLSLKDREDEIFMTDYFLNKKITVKQYSRIDLWVKSVGLRNQKNYPNIIIWSLNLLLKF